MWNLRDSLDDTDFDSDERVAREFLDEEDSQEELVRDDEDEDTSESIDSEDDDISESYDDGSGTADDWLTFDEPVSPAAARGISRPFWFSYEDKDQIREIVRLYDTTLELPEERRKSVRQPEAFVGRVQRRVVTPDGDQFTTLDTVEVFRRVSVPPGAPLPPTCRLRVCKVLTQWANDDGLPLNQTLLKLGSAVVARWQARVVHRIPPSYLLCLPIFGSAMDFDYVVSSQELEVCYSPNSPALRKHRHWYDVERFLPRGRRCVPGD